MWVESLKLISDNNHCFSIPQKGQIFPLTSAILRLLKIPGTFALMSSKLCKILKEMRILDHLTCLLRNLYAGQEGARRSKQSILKEISPVISLEGMMLKLKLQYLGHLMRIVDHWKRL